MEHNQMNPEEAIIIGDLSKLYQLSKRTLRLYHDEGLLIPYYVNEQTGYRYYSPSQIPRLEMILQMKSAGLSLKQIKKMLDMKNLSLFEAVLGEQIDSLDKKISEYKVCKNSLSKQLESCTHLRNPPVLDSIFIEYIPRRMAFIYDDIHSYDLKQEYPDGSPWRTALKQVKSVFLKQGIPLALFHQVGGIISKESLLQNQFILSGTFIQLNDDLEYGLPRSSIDPGTYVCIYHQYAAMDNAAESRGIQLLLDYISDNHYQILGPYLAQVVAETAIFDYNDSNILVKQQIPVKVLP